MNTAAAQLLQSLDTLGVQRVRFRILSLGRHLRHTIPVGLSDELPRAGKPLPSLSVPDLFAAYSLPPHKGEYVLDVDDGRLALTPAVPRTVAKFKGRAKSPSSGRNRRTRLAAAHHKLAA